MENKIIIGNMKMYMNLKDIKDYLEKIGNLKNNVIICPSSIYIPYFIEKNINTGIQNIYYEDNGAYTGEISVEQIKSMNINYVIIGHSERRSYFHENDYNINKKTKKIIEKNLKSIICIGETLEEKSNNKTIEVLRQQLEIDLNGISKNYQDNIIIAYEPRWAIGTGIIPSNEEIKTTIEYIKSFIQKNNNMDIKVLYGGSINESNIETLLNINNLDGFLIGHSCTNPDKFKNIIDRINTFDK